MNQAVRKTLFSLVLLILPLILCTSCSSYLGWGVLLWGNDENGLAPGTVLPVYFKSNIDSVWVVGSASSGPGLSSKIELPLWQLEFYRSKGKAESRAKRLGEYQRTYAETLLDGLPLRSDPDGAARQTYRLRQGQIVKVLAKAKGVPPSNGGAPLPGDWLLVLTDDGSQGYCFSFRLRLYEHSPAAPAMGPAAAGKAAAPLNETFVRLISRDWFPEAYAEMVEDERIDLSRFVAGNGLFVDASAGTIRVNLPPKKLEWHFSSVLEDGDNYRFVGTSVLLLPKGDDRLEVRWQDDKGKKQKLRFVSFSVPGQKIIATEEERRHELFLALYRRGPILAGPDSGRLTLSDNGQFTWEGAEKLRPSVLPQGTTGRAEIDLFLSPGLQKHYDGAVSFYFDGAKDPARFLYVLESGALRLESIAPASIDQSLVKKRTSKAAGFLLRRVDR